MSSLPAAPPATPAPSASLAPAAVAPVVAPAIAPAIAPADAASLATSLAPAEPVVLSTHALSKRYGQSFALRELNLEVYRGEVLGYLGPNGAGKTTTIRLLLGLIAPTQGSAQIFGMDVQRQA